MNVESFKAPQTLKVNNYFKNNTLNTWCPGAHFYHCKSNNPHVTPSIARTQFHNDLDNMLNAPSEVVPNEVKTKLGYIKQASKKTKRKSKKRADSPARVNISFVNSNHNSYSDKAVYIDNRTISAKSDGRTDGEPTETSSDTATATTATTPNGLANFVNQPFDGSIMETANLADKENVLTSLFFTLYNLYKGSEPAQIQRLEPRTSRNRIFNYCADQLQNFNKLTSKQRSDLHVLLSGVINTVDLNYRDEIKTILGDDKLKAILQEHVATIHENYLNERWIQIKEKFRSYYTGDNAKVMSAIQEYVTREKSTIIGDDHLISKSFELKIFMTIDYIIDQCRYGKLNRQKSEEPFFTYWKHVLATLFQDTNIRLKTGEQTSYATKIQREVNEFEYGNLDESIPGRRIDLLLTGDILDNKDNQVDTELSSIEIKPACATDDVEQIQFNKNVRTSKCLLYQYLVHCGEKGNDIHIISMDIIGLNGFFYDVYQYEDIIIAVKEIEEPLFLPGDEDDFEEFIKSTTMDQLLYYVEFVTQMDKYLRKISKRYKRRRISQKKSGLFCPSETPLLLENFPIHTYFTPKR